VGSLRCWRGGPKRGSTGTGGWKGRKSKETGREKREKTNVKKRGRRTEKEKKPKGDAQGLRERGGERKSGYVSEG